MGFWLFMLVCNLLVPGIMLAAGWIMWKHPPKKINGLMGYRTRRSMKNMDTWKFAHAYCGKLWWKIGWGLLVISAVVFLFAADPASEQRTGSVGAVLCLVQCVILLVSIIPTERALKRNFTDAGERRDGKN